MSGIRKAVVPNSLTQGWDGAGGGGLGNIFSPAWGFFQLGSLAGIRAVSSLVEADVEGMGKGGAGWWDQVPGSPHRGLTPLGMGCSGQWGNGRGAQCCWGKKQQLAASHCASGCPTTPCLLCPQASSHQ